MKPYFIQITEANSGQRIDNFLFTFLKGVPKSRLYRAIRQGEVRINKHRIKPEYHLKIGDSVRIPPIRASETSVPGKPPHWQQKELTQNILYEDNDLIILNKPAGMAVHGGSGVNFGVIETLRFLRQHAKFLELVHRLDRDTSGCLMIAKKRSILTLLHKMLFEHQIEKVYLALVKGSWQGGTKKVTLPLLKSQQVSGERKVKVNESGKMATTIFHPLSHFKDATLVKIILKTGRTHQIRVHAAHLGFPIAGDEKYGDKNFNQAMRKKGVKRLFLHAASLSFQLLDKNISICACLDNDLQNAISNLI
jgi:23S rRNA pseudouridine955/2504/2580 synthase